MASECIQSALHDIRRIDRMTGSNRRQANVIPIYVEFGQITVWRPITRERRQTAFNRDNETAAEQQEHATNAGEAPNQEQANREANEPPNNEPQAEENGEENEPLNPENAQPRYGRQLVAQDVTQDFTSVSLDVNAARRDLEAANMALQEGNTDAADSNLKAVQDRVDMVYVAEDRPLVQARQNLILARDMASQGRYADMRAPLREAASALQTYQSEGTPHADEAAQLSQQITSYLAQPSPSAANASAVQQVDNWWNKTQGWSSSPSVSQSPSD
ncbi:MAG TPA: hypothetical protein VKV17_15660 [Bryobacteraceae bacterium]|nr:hypothetical protein [Bryobacteraceae bacterium]